MTRFTKFIKHAFGLKKGEENELGDAESELLLKLARGIVSRGLSTPAIMFLESVRPLTFISSQAMTFFRPIIGAVFSSSSYETIERLLERRESIDWLITKIEEIEGEEE